jgi:hypothetical protein
MKVRIGIATTIFFLILTQSACMIDDAGPMKPYVAPFECVDLPPLPGFLLEWKTINPNEWYEGMCVNPNDPDEVVLSYVDFQSGYDSTFVYNLRTKQRRLLLPLYSYSLSWGKRDWILIDGPGILKIKPNGDSLTNFNLPPFSSRPIFNPAGDRIAVFLSAAASSGFHIVDLDGNIQDSIQAIGACDWYADDSILGYNLDQGTQQQSIQIMQVSTKKLHYVMPVPLDVNNSWNGVRQIRMFGDHNHAAVLTGNGLWVVSTKTKTVKRLAESCDNRRIYSIRLAPYDRYIYAEENGFIQVDSITVKHIITTVVLDAETGERVDTLFHAAPH